MSYLVAMLRWWARLPVRVLKAVLARAGYRLSIHKIRRPTGRTGVHLNVGASGYTLKGYVSLDLYTPHYYGSPARFRKLGRVPYDMRADDLPYADGTVDTIYCSHVIEHVETPHVERFVAEALRVLKPGGVLRIVCPDAAFLFAVSRFRNDAFPWVYRRGRWRRPAPQMSPSDHLIRVLCKPRLAMEGYGLPRPLNEMQYDELLKTLPEGIAFDRERPEQHINAWDEARLIELGRRTGFREVVKSKPGGSICADLQGDDIDGVHQRMSLYVDMLK